MAVTRVGVATGTTTATVPAHAVGDLIIIAAFRNTTGTPSLPAGYTSILTKVGTVSSMRVGYKIATATNDASGTWTNSTALVCHVYRSSNYATGSSLYVGGSASNSSTTNTVNYPALTMTHGDNTSWAIGFAGVGNLTETVSTAPAGMTNQSLETAAATQCAGQDTNGTVSSWSSTNATTTGAAGNSVSATVELIENQPGTVINNIIQWVSTSYNAVISTQAGNNFAIPLPNPTLSGNGMIICVMYPSTNTPVITDDKGNTWPLSGAAGTVTADSGDSVLQIFRLVTATAGTKIVTIGFGSTVVQPFKAWIGELYNITGTVNGTLTTGATPVNASGILSPGSFTPTNNNANGGNLIFAFTANKNGTSGANPHMFVPETGYFLNDADVSWVNTQGNPNASQFYLQATSAATTPRFYTQSAGADTYNVVAMALSVGTQGTAKPAGIHVDAMRYLSCAGNPASWFNQIPSTGNLGVLTGNMNTSGTIPSWTAVVDSNGTSWTRIDPSPGNTPAMYYNANQTAAPNRTMTVTLTGGTGQVAGMIYYDISGAATSPFDVAGSGQTANAQGLSSVSYASIITPTTQNGIVIGYMFMGLGPSTTMTSPTGALTDLPSYQVASGTGSISGTSFTVASTAWGSFFSSNNLIAGPNITAGTSIVSGAASPFTVSISQTAASGAVTQANTDGDPMTFGNFAGHYYNGTNTSAETWTINITNQGTAQGTNLTVAAFKAAPSGNTLFAQIIC